MAEEEDTEEFLRQIISNRLEVLSKNTKLVKMLIAESLMGNLEDEVNFPNIIFSSLKDGLDIHFDKLNKKVDTDFCAKQLAGIFLSHIILPSEKPFHELDDHTKDILVMKYVQSIKI